MNFTNMHELEWEYGYEMFWVVNCLLTSSVVWFMHKRKMFHRMQVRAPTALLHARPRGSALLWLVAALLQCSFLPRGCRRLHRTPSVLQLLHNRAAIAY